MSKLIQKYRDQFLMINQCKDEDQRTMQLSALMTEMEGEFKIPILYDAEFARKNAVALALYKDISNARVF